MIGTTQVASLFAQSDPPALNVPKADWGALAPFITLTATVVVLLILSTVVAKRLPAWVSATVAALGAATAFAFLFPLWSRVIDDGPIGVFGGALTVDGFGVLGSAVVVFSAFVSVLLFERAPRQNQRSAVEPVTLVLLSAIGGMVMATAGDLIVLFVGIEVLSIAVYVLAASNAKRIASQEAGLKYFIMGAVASAILLYGIALVFGGVGSLRFAAIRRALESPLSDNRLVIGGLVLMLVGFGFKVAAAPFHSWAPDVYQGSPSAAVAYMASAVKAAAFLGLVRVLNGALGAFAGEWRAIVVILAVASLIVGAFGAIVQTNVKRMLAYSAIAHAGFMLVGVAAGSGQGAKSVVVYAAIYAVMAMGSFGVLVALADRTDGNFDLSSFAGLSSREPLLAGLLALFLLAQAGTPFTGGFIAKLGVIRAAADASMWPLAATAMLSTVVSAYLYLRIVTSMYFSDPDEATTASDADGAVGAPAWIALTVCAVAILVTGLLPGILAGLAGSAQLAVLGG